MNRVPAVFGVYITAEAGSASVFTDCTASSKLFIFKGATKL